MRITYFSIREHRSWTTAMNDPLSLLWFNILMVVIPLVVFFLAIYVSYRRFKEDESEAPEPAVIAY